MSVRTTLHDLHLDIGAKMVPFAGYDMPLQYSDGIKNEHLHCRDAAGLFDVSHMGQFTVRGTGASLALEKLLPIDINSLSSNQQIYTLLLNHDGGIRDDLIITRWHQDYFFIVVNAACKQQDIEYFRQYLPSHIGIEELDQHALLALQGPKAVTVMQRLSLEAIALTFMHGCHTSLLGADCYVTRSGYTGEDGFEISVPATGVEALARKLLDFDEVRPVGLGARDSLRLEAGLCLYGHDMDDNTTPVEAALVWAISQSRRVGGAKEGGFPGADVILGQIAQGTTRKRVGLQIEGRVPARQGTELQDPSGNIIGQVTSGGFTPSLQQPIAMAYVNTDCATVGSQLQAVIRGKSYPATVSKMPFVPQHYYRG